VKGLRGRAKMKITDIVAVLHKAATDMQAFATRNNDLNLPDPVVLPFIMNFQTDELMSGFGNYRQTAQVVD
jgi:hypothetical protein